MIMIIRIPATIVNVIYTGCVINTDLNFFNNNPNKPTRNKNVSAIVRNNIKNTHISITICNPNKPSNNWLAFCPIL